jgi:hypothetical protein
VQAYQCCAFTACILNFCKRNPPAALCYLGCSPGRGTAEIGALAHQLSAVPPARPYYGSSPQGPAARPRVCLTSAAAAAAAAAAASSSFGALVTALGAGGTGLVGCAVVPSSISAAGPLAALRSSSAAS